jgi:hypothetical protein
MLKSKLEDYYERTGLGSFPPEEKVEENKPKEKPLEGSVAYYQDLLERGNIEVAKKWLKGKTPELSRDDLTLRRTELIKALVRHGNTHLDARNYIFNLRKAKDLSDDEWDILSDAATAALNKKNGLIL